MSKIHEVYPDRQYFLDIDPFYDKEAKRPAQYEYYELIESTDTGQRWIDFIDRYENAYPCIQVKNASPAAIRHQIECFSDRLRFFLVRLENGGGQDFNAIIDTVCQTAHANFGFVIDAGWSNDLISRALWVDGLVKRIVRLRGNQIPIITTGSSFPNSFTDFEMGESVPVVERLLFSQIVQANNEGRIIYGDWASSRSPSEGGGGGPIPPRLELPTASSWEIYRADDECPEFEDLAEALADSSSYEPDLNIWATYKIEATRIGDTNGISSLRTAAAVRINMHLYRQIHFDNFNPLLDTDDDYID